MFQEKYFFCVHKLSEHMQKKSPLLVDTWTRLNGLDIIMGK